ncbi:MAG: AarF/ABC1/UbiB kinase family protein [Acidimicrobiales bacterium]|nr:AarF/ABC1/UbiB kinase family protein [Acidimicrobiales bacterium]
MSRPRLPLAAAVVVAGVAAVAVARRRRDRAGDAPVVTGSSTLSRNARIGAVGARSAGRYAAHVARRTFADAERREALEQEFQLRTADDVVATLGNMKGAMMKLGQMASYLDQGLPEPVREALSQLRSDAPPMSGELAAQAIERELGQPPDRLFAEWDPVPIASASIGQVHRALTHDERAVAVKVQYPGIDAAIRSDLSSVGLLFTSMGAVYPGLEPGPLIEELKSRLAEELDYGLEARNQAAFADAFRGHPFIHVPDVVPELSTDRVLTSELAVGEPFETIVASDQATRDRAGEIIYRFVFRSLYGLRMFNGDPHPGNYLFGADGRVTFLDFGLVKHFTEGELADFSSMVEEVSFRRDPARFRALIERIGLLRAGAPFTDDQVMSYFAHFYALVDERGPTTITPEYASATVRQIFDQSGPDGDLLKATNVPPSFVIIQRINLGLYAILGELNATADWRGISEELWPFVAGGPNTPLGEEEADWRARRTRDGAPVG